VTRSGTRCRVEEKAVTFILVPLEGNPNDDLQVNGWNWRPTLELLRRARLLDEETLERAAAQGAGGRVTGEQALRIAEFLDRYLAGLTPGHRVRCDGTVTSAPQRYELDQETRELYTATYEWLSQFRDFCRARGGFTVV
jgi:hypothetical protein